MPKEKSPLKALQKDGDNLKKEIDAFMEECGLVLDDPKLKDRNARMKKLFKRCGDYRKKCKALEKKLNNLSKGKEPTVIPDFDEAKDREVERMRVLEVRLSKVGNKLEPDEVEESYFRKVTNEGSSKAELDDDDDDEEEEEEDDEDYEDDDKKEEEEKEEEDLDDDGDDSMMDDASPEKEENEDEDGDNEKNQDDSATSKSKFSRMGIFRRSKAGVKDEEGKKDKAKEKTDKEKEKERKEQEKKEKKEKEKLDKERKEKEKKEQKEKEKEEKKKKKEVGGKKKSEVEEEEEKRAESPGKRSFGAKLFSRDSKKPKMDEKKGAAEDDDDEEGEEEEESGGEEEEMEGESGEEEEEEDEEKEEKQKQVKIAQEKDAVKPDKKKGFGLFKRDKSAERKVKKENEKDSKNKKDAKNVQVQKEEEDEEDEEEEEEYEEEEGEESGEEDEDEELDEEEVEEEEESEEEEEEEEGEEDEEEEEEEEELRAESEEESEEEFKRPDEGMDLFEAVCDFDGEEEDDLSFKRGSILTILSERDDGWWMAEDEEGNKGMVPSTYLKLKKDNDDFRDLQSPEPDAPADSASPRSGKDLWRGLKKSVNETGVTDVLSAMGAIPSGFRPSTTARHLKSEAYTLCNFLKPRFSESRLGFQDLNWSPQENQIRAKVVRLQKLLSVMMVRNVPVCGVGIDVKSRCIRICFFDGDKILSNIHTVQATWNVNDPKTWRFSPKVTGMLPSILDGDCFVRSSHTVDRIGLLFELCISYSRPKTGEKGELSCGWVHLPLVDSTTSAPIINKIYDLHVNGGTPYEQDVEVDPSISRRSSSSKFRAMMSANKQPRLQIKFMTPTKEQKQLLDLLPETLVTSLSYLPFLTFFRKIQGDEVLRDRIDLQNADLIHSPMLANFPEAAKYPDVMDALRSCWADKKAKNKKVDKRDQEQMKTMFTSTFMESVYPILRLPSLPPYKAGDDERKSERWTVISEYQKSNNEKGILAAFLAPGGDHAPFDMSEISYNLLDAYQEIS